ncbi:MAG: helix-turn-helix domain-containing protein [Acholeplasmatales bacterium]|nr:helix-turn-helix domain-containing protein [Acholeplasmatales bacterium]
MRFTLIKRSYDNKDMILDVLKSLLGVSLKYRENERYLVFYHNHNIVEIEQVLSALSDAMMFPLLGYTSRDIDDDKLKVELDIASELIEDLPYNMYDLKQALLVKTNITNKRRILDFILDSTGITEDFIKDFVQYDLNTSKASKAMYIHRNTMLYKLDKLYDISGFDLRSFKDAYVLYSLIESK